MIQEPFALLSYLLAVIAGLFALARLPALERLFHFVPPVLWILLIPTLSTTFGLIPKEHALYDWLQDYVMVAALFLLLTATNLKSIARLGAPALIMMLTASLSLAVGAVTAFVALRLWLPADAWTAFGALTGVWTGGYGNMLAVSTSVNASAGMVANVIITDTIIGYGWMSLLITMAGMQGRLDRWIGADRTVLDDLNQRLSEMHAAHDRPAKVGDLAIMIGLAFGVAFIAAAAGGVLPSAGGVMSAFTWTVILASAAGIACSLTPISRLQYAGATPVGTFLLYVVYAAIGARADLRGVASAPLFLLAGVLILVFHAAVMLLVARLLRAPAFLLVTASQANVGGMATAPIVASVYQPALPGVAVLLVPLGLAYGTFVALAVAAVCRALA
ncbi:DUF819 domain-containing protein [Phenylobacterium immobile]|uniref:DUF819 family protein n=1 Tax=Phenylobacterium immobile TaxID=21 RepID=UPI000A5FE287|nr:DUF819 family protein [Phenylobacterium immobile]